MKYQSKSFTVPTGSRKEENCEHGWVQPKTLRCVLCGKQTGTFDGITLRHDNYTWDTRKVVISSSKTLKWSDLGDPDNF